MKTGKLMILALLLVGASWACADTPPPIPATPAAVDNLLYVRTFDLEKGEKFFWSKEKPMMTTGTLLVIEVKDKNLVVPRAIAMPVLYVGNQPAQRINEGHKSGRVIAIVPGEVDLLKEPIWFGTPELPENVDANMAKAERKLADKAGIKPFDEKTVKAAQAKGGETKLTAPDMHTLLRDNVAELILEYCPDEKHLADDFRVPVIKRETPKKPEKSKPAEDED
jgi:hypothetical protein